MSEKYLLRDGDRIILELSDKLIELEVNNFSPIGLKVWKIYDQRPQYDETYKKFSKALKKYAKELDEELETWDE